MQWLKCIAVKTCTNFDLFVFDPGFGGSGRWVEFYGVTSESKIAKFGTVHHDVHSVQGGRVNANYIARFGTHFGPLLAQSHFGSTPTMLDLDHGKCRREPSQEELSTSVWNASAYSCARPAHQNCCEARFWHKLTRNLGFHDVWGLSTSSISNKIK